MKVGEFLDTVLRPYGIDVILSISTKQLSIFDVSCMYGYKPNKVAGDYIIYMVVPAIERRYVATIFDFYVTCDAKQILIKYIKNWFTN